MGVEEGGEGRGMENGRVEDGGGGRGRRTRDGEREGRRWGWRKGAKDEGRRTGG